MKDIFQLANPRDRFNWYCISLLFVASFHNGLKPPRPHLQIWLLNSTTTARVRPHKESARGTTYTCVAMTWRVTCWVVGGCYRADTPQGGRGRTAREEPPEDIVRGVGEAALLHGWWCGSSCYILLLRSHPSPECSEEINGLQYNVSRV